MTEAKKIVLTPGYRANRALRLDSEDGSFAAYLAEQLRRLPSDSQFNAMIEILAIINHFMMMQNGV